MISWHLIMVVIHSTEKQSKLQLMYTSTWLTMHETLPTANIIWQLHVRQPPIHFYPRDAMLARVFATATCPSVCLSVMRRCCVKTKKASVMISSLSGSPTILVFWRQISSQNSKGVTPIGASNKGEVGKISSFLSLSVNISITVAAMAKVMIND